MRLVVLLALSAAVLAGSAFASSNRNAYCLNSDGSYGYEGDGSYGGVRPVEFGDGSAPPGCAESNGDPHFTSWDGLHYDMQLVGAFTNVDSPASSAATRSLLITSCQEPSDWWTGAASSTASAATTRAVFVEFDGKSVLVGHNGGADGVVLSVDGTEQNFGAGFEDIVATDSPGHALRVTVTQQQFSTVSVLIQTSSGDKIKVNVQGLSRWIFLDTTISLSPNREGSASGLLGNYDNDCANDFVDQAGEPVTSESAFGEAWRVQGTFANGQFQCAAPADYPDYQPYSASQFCEDVEAEARQAESYINCRGGFFGFVGGIMQDLDGGLELERPQAVSSEDAKKQLFSGSRKAIANLAAASEEERAAAFAKFRAQSKAGDNTPLLNSFFEALECVLALMFSFRPEPVNLVILTDLVFDACVMIASNPDGPTCRALDNNFNTLITSERLMTYCPSDCNGNGACDVASGTYVSDYDGSSFSGTSQCRCFPGFSGDECEINDACNDCPTSCVEGICLAAVVGGDPHLIGFLGQKFNLLGEDKAVYNMLSTPAIQYNARLSATPFLHKGKHATLIRDMGLVIRAPANVNSPPARLQVFLDVETLETRVEVNGEPLVLAEGDAHFFFGEDAAPELFMRRTEAGLVVSTPLVSFYIKAVQKRLPHLDDGIKLNDWSDVASMHGLLGQTARPDRAPKDALAANKELNVDFVWPEYLDGSLADYVEQDILTTESVFSRFN